MRRSWQLRGKHDNYAVALASELKGRETPQQVPSDQLIEELEGWVFSSLVVLLEMCKATGRTPPPGPPWQSEDAARQQLKRLLSEMFQSRRLVAFPVELKPLQVGELLVPPSLPADVVDAGELIRESTPPPPPKASPIRNVNEDEQSCSLKDAAKDGTPFCEVCETLNRKLIA